MKIKNWLIHKLGGITVTNQEIISPKIEKINAYFIDRCSSLPEDYILDLLVRDLMPEIKSKMKVTKKREHPGEVCYQAELFIVENE